MDIHTYKHNEKNHSLYGTDFNAPTIKRDLKTDLKILIGQDGHSKQIKNRTAQTEEIVKKLKEREPTSDIHLNESETNIKLLLVLSSQTSIKIFYNVYYKMTDVIILASILMTLGGVSCYCIKIRIDRKKNSIAILDISESTPYTMCV